MKNRDDQAIRLIFTYDQLPFEGTNGFCLKKFVGKIAVQVRDTFIPIERIADSVKSMRTTFEENSKPWAVLGCVLNILEPHRASLN